MPVQTLGWTHALSSSDAHSLQRERVVLRAGHGPERLPGYFAGQCVYAHTSPVTVRVDGRPPKTDPAAVAGLLGHLGKMQTWVEREARCGDRQREHLAGIFRSARDELARRQAAR